MNNVFQARREQPDTSLPISPHHPPSTLHRPPSSRNRGAALLIVIGLLCLLLIAAVAFSILMTVERSASANYRHSVQARQLLYAGLAQAIADIDFDVGSKPYPGWTNFTQKVGVGPRTVDRKMDVLQSIDHTVTAVGEQCPASVLSEEALKYLPRSLHESADLVKPEALSFSVNGSIIGRYAYVAANVSGLLDANTVGAITNRWTGTNAGEIQIADSLPFEVINATAFLLERTSYKRYESVRELTSLPTTGLNPNKVANFEAFSYAPPEKKAPDGSDKVFIGYDPALPGTLVDQLKNKKSAIEAAFGKCGVDKSMGDFPAASCKTWAYQALIDYVDDDLKPEGTPNDDGVGCLDRPTTEDTACIQSVGLYMIYNQNTADGTTFQHDITYTFLIDISRPFVGTNAPMQYTVIAEARLYDMSLDPAQWKELLPWKDYNDSNYSLIIPPDPSGIPPLGENVCGGNPAVSMQLTIPRSKLVDNPNAEVNCAIYVRVQVVDSKGDVVDQVPAGPAAFDDETRWVRFSFDRTFGLETTVNEEYAVWTEAIDPTVNWNGNPSAAQWCSSEELPVLSSGLSLLEYYKLAPEFQVGGGLFAGTPAAPDTAWTYLYKVFGNYSGGSLASYMLQHSAALDVYNDVMDVGGGRQIVPDGARLGGDENYWDNSSAWKRHYVKNGPLESVGELGYLNIGRWMTINLYPHGHNKTFGLLPAEGFHRVLDYFTVRNPKGQAARGLVNLNSPNSNVHACVFYQQPLDEWKKGFGSSAILSTPNESKNFGQRLVAKCGSVTNLSDLGKFWTGANLGRLDGLPFADPGGAAADYPAYVISKEVGASSGNHWFGEFEREGVIRNAVQLYTARQQIYTIVVRADAMTFEFGGKVAGVNSANPLNQGTVLGSAHAIFQVWRDAEEGPNGTHPCFVRLCKVLGL